MKRQIHESLTGSTKLELEKLLSDLCDKQPSLIGAMIIGHDGSILLSFFPEDIDVETIAASALEIFRQSELIVGELNQAQMRQVVAQTSRECLVTADFGGGLLIASSRMPYC